MPRPAPGDQPAVSPPWTGVLPPPVYVPGLVVYPPRVVGKPGPGHVYRPPTRNERERKVRVPYGAVVRVVRGVLSGATEVLDWLDALWDALPDDFKAREFARRHGKAPSPQNKAKQLWDNINAIDIEKAFLNVWKENIEDSIYGTANREGRKRGVPQPSRLPQLPQL